MFKAAIYLNIFFFFVMSIVLLIKVFSDEADLKKIRRMSYIYILLNFINGNVSGFTDVGWDWVRFLPVMVLTFILNIICIICVKRKLKKAEETDYKPMNIKVMLLLLVLPIIIVVVPFSYEAYILYNCDYMVIYNYQEAWINSTDTNIAIYNNKPVVLSLELDAFDREGEKVKVKHCDAVYSDNGVELTIGVLDEEVIQNENLERVALDAVEKCPNAKSAYIYYFESEKYAIITLLEEIGHGTILDEYFYYNNDLVTSISPLGDLEKVICYK